MPSGRRDARMPSERGPDPQVKVSPSPPRPQSSPTAAKTDAGPKPTAASQERKAIGEHMRAARARRLEREGRKSTDDREMLFGKDKFE